MLPFISIIIPCRNEEKYIGKCLESITLQDYPKEKMEVFVINGASEDKTGKIIQDYARKYPYIKILENPKRYTPFGLNIGLKEAKGEVIARMDSHAGYEKDYVSKCVKHLLESGADNVGGVIKTLPARDTISAKAVALVLSHPFGAAGSYFRIGSKEPKYVDTVFGGCYKRDVFDKIGFFNEKLLRSQDIEFNQRLKNAGGKIFLAPEIKAIYYPQPDFSRFLKHNFFDGVWTIYPLKFGVKIFSWRHLIPLLFVLTLLICGILGVFLPLFSNLFFLILKIYFLASVIFSLQIAFKEKNIKLFFFLPIAFASRHFGYGLGSLYALIKIYKK
ncbi:MAG: glycosyltransferase family 2 protein [bacterium]|nr:glycosyltransferase family 2 protein [bacterium]